MHMEGTGSSEVSNRCLNLLATRALHTWAHPSSVMEKATHYTSVLPQKLHLHVGRLRPEALDILDSIMGHVHDN